MTSCPLLDGKHCQICGGSMPRWLFSRHEKSAVRERAEQRLTAERHEKLWNEGFNRLALVPKGAA
jgi:hypothetical protein